MLKDLKRIPIFVIIFMMLCPANNIFAEETDSTQGGETETKNELQYRIDYMDEIERFDTGKFLDGVTVNDVKINNKDSLDLIFDLGIYLLPEDYEAAQNNEPVNTKAEDYLKYDKSITRADLFYVLNQLITGDMEMSKEYKNAGYSERVTMGEALDYMIKLLGYEGIAETIGREQIVSENKLLNGIKDYKTEKYMTFGDLSVMLINTLEAYGIEKNYDGYKESYSQAKEKFMERQLHIYKIEGFVNAVGAQDIFKNQALNADEAEIGREKYLIGNSNVKDCLGKYVTAYFYDNDGRNVLRHVQLNKKNNSVAFDLHDADYSGEKFVFHDKTRKQIDASNIQYILYNGYSTQDLSVLKELDGKDGTALLSSSEKNGKYDVAIINTYSYFVVYSVDSYKERITFRYNAKLNGSNYVDMDNFEEIDCKRNGVSIDYTDIKSGATVRILACEENKYIQILSYNESINGKIGSVDDDNVEINGKQYRISETYMTNSENKQLKSGDKGLFYVSEDGYIAGFKSGNEMTYGYIYRLYSDESGDTASIEIFTQDGKWETYAIKDKNAEIDGVKRTSAEAYKYLIAGNVKNSVCRYKVNLEDEIIFLDTLLEEPAEASDENRMRLAYEGNVKQSWYCEWFRSDIGYRVRSSSVVFEIPSDISRKDDYAVRGGTVLSADEETVFLKLYCPNSMNICDVVVKGESNESVGDEVRQLFYCENISEIYDENRDEICYAMNGKLFMINQNIGDEEKRTFKISNSNKEKFEKEYPGILSKGTLINFASNSEDYITGIEPLIINDKIPEDFHKNDNAYYQKFAGTISSVDMDEGYFSVTTLGNEVVSNLNTCICIDSQTQSARSVGLGDLTVGERIYVIRTGGGARFAAVVR